MNELALFTGIGGGILGTGFRTVCGVESDEFCRARLLQRQDEGYLDRFPIWDDVKTFDGRPWRGCVHLVSGGFPCQPWSSSGKQKGELDSRNLWPDTIRIIRQVEPRFVFLENSPRLRDFPYFGRILGDLAGSGFNIRWTRVSTKSLGANHGRSRLWILAYSSLVRLAQPASFQELARKRLGLSHWWDSEPEFRRMDDGNPEGLERIRVLGNAQVPGVARLAFEILRRGLI